MEIYSITHFLIKQVGYILEKNDNMKFKSMSASFQNVISLIVEHRNLVFVVLFKMSLKRASGF